MKKPRLCFGHFFLEFLGPNEARRGTPFSVTFFSPLSLLDSSSVVTLTNSRMLQIFSTLTLTLSLFGSSFFFEQKTGGVKYHQLTTTKVVVVFCCYLAFTVYDITKLGEILVK